jgi:hypothetical protein
MLFFSCSRCIEGLYFGKYAPLREGGHHLGALAKKYEKGEDKKK